MTRGSLHETVSPGEKLAEKKSGLLICKELVLRYISEGVCFYLSCPEPGGTALATFTK
jgi:hypothetical protein